LSGRHRCLLYCKIWYRYWPCGRWAGVEWGGIRPGLCGTSLNVPFISWKKRKTINQNKLSKLFLYKSGGDNKSLKISVIGSNVLNTLIVVLLLFYVCQKRILLEAPTRSYYHYYYFILLLRGAIVLCCCVLSTSRALYIGQLVQLVRPTNRWNIFLVRFTFLESTAQTWDELINANLAT